MRRTAILLVALPWALGLSAGPAGAHPSDRNGFMVGFGLGGASLGFGRSYSSPLVGAVRGRSGGVTGNLRIGYAVRPDLVVHLESNAWIKHYAEVRVVAPYYTSYSAARITLYSAWMAAATYYVPRTGVFLRGGAGIGRAESYLTKRNEIYGNVGVALLAASGWEWRLTKRFALAPQIEYTYIDLNTSYQRSSNMIGGGLGFDWYW